MLPTSPFFNKNRNLNTNTDYTPSKIAKTGVGTTIGAREFLNNLALILTPGGEGLGYVQADPDFKSYVHAIRDIFLFALFNDDHDVVTITLDNNRKLTLKKTARSVEMEIDGESATSNQTIPNLVDASINEFERYLLVDSDEEEYDESSEPELRTLFRKLGISDMSIEDSEEDSASSIAIPGKVNVICNQSVSELKETMGNTLAKFYGFDEKGLYAFATNVNTEKNILIYNKPFTGPIDKSQQHIKIKDTRTIAQLNGEVAMPNSDERYFCRHLTAQEIKHLIAFLKNPNQKDKYTLAPFDNKNSIASTMPKENVENDFESLQANGYSYVIFDNDKFGTHLQNCFRDLQKNVASSSVFLLRSTTHAMRIWLQIEDGDEKPFKVHFFDPNKSNVQSSREFKAIEELESFTLTECINGANSVQEGTDYYQLYYGKTSPYSMMIECYSNRATQDTRRVEKKIVNFDKNALSSAHILYLISIQFYNVLDELTEKQLQKMAEKYPEEIFNMIRSESPPNWLQWALAANNRSISRVVLRLMRHVESSLTEAQFAELVAAKNAEGVPVICVALQNNCSQFVQFFSEHLLQFHEDMTFETRTHCVELAKEIVKTLTTEDADQIPLIHKAFATNDVNAIKAFLPLLRWLKQFTDQNTLVKLVYAGNDVGESGGYVARKNGYGSATTAWLKWLELIKHDGVLWDKVVGAFRSGKSHFFLD